MKPHALAAAVAVLLATTSCYSSYALSPAEVALRLDTLEEGHGITTRILEFSGDGHLTNPADLVDLVPIPTRGTTARSLASDEPVAHEWDRVIVLCHGWNYELHESTREYLRMLEDYASSDFGPPNADGKVLVLCVRWDSRFSATRDLLDAVLPFPGIAELIGYLPDTVLFPVSFWANANDADHIGAGIHALLDDLYGRWRSTLGEDGCPPLFLVGHSFGGRALTETIVASQHTNNEYRNCLRGALLVQAATHEYSLPSAPEIPVLVTYNFHDKAVGSLYPIGNTALPMAPSRFTAARIPIGFAKFPGFEDAYDGYEVFRNPEGEKEPVVDGTEDPTERVRTVDRDRYLRESALIVSSAFSPTVAHSIAKALRGRWPEGLAIAQGLTWLWAGASVAPQLYETVADHRGVLEGTIGSVPLLGPIARWAGSSITGNDRWGRARAGLLSGGAALNAAGAPPIQGGGISFEEFRDDPHLGPGVIRIDVSNEIRRGNLLFIDYDMGRFPGTLLAFLDPSGAHSDFRNDTIYQLINLLIESAGPGSPRQ